MASSLNTECKDFEGTVHDGYGIFPNGERAHVFAYINTYGPIPKSKQVNHRCGRRICVEPTHLYVGTHAENMEDAAREGTLNSVKLTPEEVKEIRELREAGMTQADLGLLYDVNQSVICRLLNGSTWKHVA